MGFKQTIKEAFGLATPANLIGAGGAISASTGILSPWSTNQLQSFAWSEIFGLEATPMTRAEAMTVPAIVNGRARILSLAGRPLRALDGAGLVSTQPAWLYRTNSGVPPWFRTAAILDDWLFYGQSLLVLERGAGGQITDAVHLPYDRWEVSADSPTGITIDQKNVTDPLTVLYLPGPQDGLLDIAATTIRAAKDLEVTWAGKARNPIPAIVLAEREDNGMTPEEAKVYVDAVAKARRDPNGAVMFVPYGIEVSFEGTSDSSYAIEGRNGVKIDPASFMNLPASSVEAAQPKASLNYETSETEQADVADRLSFWSEPLEARLSMDDVCPRGQRIRFDFSTNPLAAGSDTGPFSED